MAEMIDTSDISLLYPDGENMRRAGLGENGARLSDVTAEQLELYYLIDLKSSDIGSFFTSDIETIRYRQETFADMAENPDLARVLLKMLPLLGDITELLFCLPHVQKLHQTTQRLLLPRPLRNRRRVR